MKILITGGSGLVGKHLTQLLVQKGHEVSWLSRGANKGSNIKTFKWNPEQDFLEDKALESVDVIVHLAGKSISERWTKNNKEQLYSSRIDSLKFLCQKIKEGNHSVKTLVSASGISYYGVKTSDKIFVEDDKNEDDFLGNLTQEWEKAANSFKELEARVVCLRTSVVLDKSDGALQKMLPSFRMNLGGVLGKGNQAFPWISLNDLIRMYLFAIENSSVEGSFNAIATKKVTQKDFAYSLASALKKKIFLPAVPAWVLKMILGEMASILLYGSWASNQKIKSTGFEFQNDDLDAFLEHHLD